MHGISKSDFVLAVLILDMCNNPTYGSQTRSNPYAIPSIVASLEFLAAEYNLKNKWDAADWVVEEYLRERGKG